MIASQYRAGLGGIEFGAYDDDGNLWVISDLEGWHTIGSTSETTQRAFRHGAWRNKAFLTGRGLTLTGAVYSPGGVAPDLLDDLVAAIPLDVLQALTIYGVHANDRQVFVRQEGVPAVQIVSPHEAVFSIGLVAPDPLKYSVVERYASTALPSSVGGLTVPFTVPFSVDSVTVSGTTIVTNDGNVDVAGRILVYGPISGARITNLATGEVLAITADLAAAEYMDIDLATHTAYLNGTASRRGYISGTWFSFIPGNNEIAFTASTFDPEANLQIIWRDGWK